MSMSKEQAQQLDKFVDSHASRDFLRFQKPSAWTAESFAALCTALCEWYRDCEESTASIRRALKEDYPQSPDDAARVGQLRGAVTTLRNNNECSPAELDAFARAVERTAEALGASAPGKGGRPARDALRAAENDLAVLFKIAGANKSHAAEQTAALLKQWFDESPRAPSIIQRI